jgi:hypothetical protein
MSLCSRSASLRPSRRSSAASDDRPRALDEYPALTTEVVPRASEASQAARNDDRPFSL